MPGGYEAAVFSGKPYVFEDFWTAVREGKLVSNAAAFP
jgi:hypothetical protein